MELECGADNNRNILGGCEIYLSGYRDDNGRGKPATGDTNERVGVHADGGFLFQRFVVHRGLAGSDASALPR
ncbi:MAG: hypothetical protein QOH17_1391 [Pseudonocardiales bacterium]|nr:hypothetical protein [Pseudonocardiales bacterium]